MRPQETVKQKRFLSLISNLFFALMGLMLASVSIGIVFFSLGRALACLGTTCDFLATLLDLVSYFIIAVAIFDVGRYLLEEEVFRDRELRSPAEARRSLTKFMVIIVIAVTLESLLAVIKVSTSETLDHLIYPAALFMVAVFLLVGLGLYQRLSVLTETEVRKD